MTYYSTNRQVQKASLHHAVTHGIAADFGLFLPHKLLPMATEFFQNLPNLSLQQIAYAVAEHLLDHAIPSHDLQDIVQKAIDFPAPLHHINSNIYALELFHGPTLSFKDFGARFMAQLLSYLCRQEPYHRNILVATSGDTGSAVAAAFESTPSVNVWILYPKGGVSHVQEQQLTTSVAENVKALEILGTFDDCQALVKQAFADSSLAPLHLTSANSINIARLLPQTFYYFYAYAQLPIGSEAPVFAVPSGNFGNLTAGLIAKRLGLPVAKFIAATNINDSVPRYLKTGVFEPLPSYQTLSNAMDVGNPSNFARMLALYNGQLEMLLQDLCGIAITDESTRQTMEQVQEQWNYQLDPHAAVAYAALQQYRQRCGGGYPAIVLETAHPAKFLEEAPMPKSLASSLSRSKRSIQVPNDYSSFKQLLLSAIS